MTSSFTTFSLDKPILKALEDIGYQEPTTVQQKVIPPLLDGNDLIVQSKTGSGKTAAFAIPICEKIEWEENKPQALILTPTRELAQQIKQDITNVGRYKRIKATDIYGKQSFEKQKLALKQKSHLVVGTPGRVLDHLEKGTLPVEAIRYLVIDEADELFNMGFIDQVHAIIEKIPKQRVTTLFSATFPQEVEALCQSYMHEPVAVKLGQANQSDNHIEQLVLNVADDKKVNALQATLITESPDSCMIFCRTQERVDTLLKQLKKEHYPAEKIHGGLEQEDRFRVMSAFKAAEFRFLVATDVAARGIDVANVPLIINFDIPLEKESYVHRIGRTGRAGKTGKAITFVTSREGKYLEMIESYIGYELNKTTVPSSGRVKANVDFFLAKINTKAVPKKAANEKLDKDIMKLYFNGGKKKKIRAIDFVGTLTNIKGVTAKDIGIITIEHSHTYIEILNGKGAHVLKAMQHTTVKGKQLKVHQARK